LLVLVRRGGPASVRFWKQACVLQRQGRRFLLLLLLHLLL
jgi:hypothetical protein